MNVRVIYKGIDVFELRCWRKLLRVPWTARRFNQSILKEISPGISLEGMIVKLKLQYFGHLTWRADSLEKTLMLGGLGVSGTPLTSISVQFSSVAQSCPTLCDPMNCSTPGLPVHHQLLEFTQTHVHHVSDAIQPSHPWSSPSPPAPNPSQHRSLVQSVSSSHEVAKVLEFQLYYRSFQRNPRADLLETPSWPPAGQIFFPICWASFWHIAPCCFSK